MTRKPIPNLIEKLRYKSGLTLEDQKESWLVSIPKGNDFKVEVLIPHQTLEWFASVKQTLHQKEVWSDWMEYYGPPSSEFEAQMASDISDFINGVLNSDLALPLRIYKEKN